MSQVSHTQDTAGFAPLPADAERWSRSPLREKIALLRRMHARVGDNAAAWVAAAARYKRLAPDDAAIGEEWMTGPWVVMRAIRELAATLDAIARTGVPPVATRARAGPAGRTILDVFPSRLADALLLPGYRGEVWLDRAATLAEVRAEAGTAFRARTTPGVVLVLGAGNVTSIAVLDALHALVVENRACIVKLNPLADAMLPVYEAAFAPLVAAGYLRFVSGDAAVGAALVADPAVTHVRWPRRRRSRLRASSAA